MSIHAEEYRDEGPRPVRFSILGQMQHRNSTNISVSPLRASSPHSYASTDQGLLRPISPEDYYSRKRAASLSYDDDEGGCEDEDQPLDFSKKLTNVNARNGGNVVIKSENWRSHSSESGVSDVCSTDSPRSDVRHSSSPAHCVSMKTPSPSNGFTHPLAQALSIASNPLAQHLKRSPDSKSEFPLYNSLSMEGKSPDITSPTLSAATSQLLNSLAAVTNGGGVNSKGGKNPRPFKAYPRDPMSLPLGLYGMPVSGLNNGELMLNQASNDAYSEFRRQMLAQVQATKTKRARSDSICLNTTKSPVPNSTSDADSNNSVNGEDYMPSHHEDAISAMAEANMLSSSPTPSIVNNPMNSHSTNSETSPVLTKGDSNKKRLGRNEDNKDEAYWERRRKNNEAAKRSRDARRAKEDEIAIRAAFLEQENLKLRFEVAALKSETAKLRCMIYQS